jgi:hypothetical protein
LRRRSGARLRAVGQLAEDTGWRTEIDSLLEAGPGRSHALVAMLLRREGPRPFDPGQPLAAQLHADSQAILDALAIERQARAAPSGDTRVPLAAALLPRPTIPPRGPSHPGAVEVVEIGDLGDPFSCRAHTTVYEELGELHEAVVWRWLYCATPRSLEASHRGGAIAEEVAEKAPGAFWDVVGTLASRGLEDGSERAMAVLRDVGADPELGRPPLDGTPLPPGPAARPDDGDGVRAATAAAAVRGRPHPLRGHRCRPTTAPRHHGRGPASVALSAPKRREERRCQATGR